MRTAAHRIKRSSPIRSVLVAATAAIGAAPPAYAGVIAQCGETTCFSDFSIFVEGMEAGGGEFSYDADTGEIALEFTNIMGDGAILRDSNNDPTGIRWMTPDGAMIDLNGLSGNADPILGFSVATTTAAAGTTVGFVFNLPIALSGPLQASSQVAYSLTSLSSAGAQISQIGTDKIVRALEVDTSVGGIGSTPKGVDVGDTFFVLGGPTATSSGPYSAVNFFTGDLAYDLMSVRINYALSANSAVALSGFVQQIIVPLPAALPLLLAGIAAFGAVARRRRLEALPL